MAETSRLVHAVRHVFLDCTRRCSQSHVMCDATVVHASVPIIPLDRIVGAFRSRRSFFLQALSIPKWTITSTDAAKYGSSKKDSLVCQLSCDSGNAVADLFHQDRRLLSLCCIDTSPHNHHLSTNMEHCRAS